MACLWKLKGNGFTPCQPGERHQGWFLNTLFAFGQAISVYVQEIDEYKNRISLSTRILETYPGELVEKFDEMMADAPNRLPLVQSKQNLGDKQEQLEKS